MTASRIRLTGMTDRTFREVFGELIRERRIANGLGLRDLADRGLMSYSYLSEVERGLKECHSATMEAIADGLGVNLYDLIIETGYRMAEIKTAVPDTPEVLFVRNSEWARQYADLVG